MGKLKMGERLTHGQHNELELDFRNPNEAIRKFVAGFRKFCGPVSDAEIKRRLTMAFQKANTFDEMLQTFDEMLQKEIREELKRRP